MQNKTTRGPTIEPKKPSLYILLGVHARPTCLLRPEGPSTKMMNILGLFLGFLPSAPCLGTWTFGGRLCASDLLNGKAEIRQKDLIEIFMARGQLGRYAGSPKWVSRSEFLPLSKGFEKGLCMDTMWHVEKG